MTISEIRTELKQVRFFYGNKEMFEKSMKVTGNAEFLSIVDKYNQAITHADPQTYSLYAGLYLENNTQESLAKTWGYTPEHVQYLHRGLLRFFQQQFNR